MTAAARAVGLCHYARDRVTGLGKGLQRRHCERRRTEVDDSHVLPLPTALLLTDLSDDQIALDAAQMVEKELAVEMIDLVLESSRQQAGTLHHALSPRSIEGAHDGAGRSCDRRIESRYAETAFLFDLQALSEDELGIDQCNELTTALAD